MGTGETTFRELLRDVIERAMRARQIISVAHLYAECLGTSERASEASYKKAKERIETEILPQLALPQGERPGKSLFAWQDAERSYRSFVKNRSNVPDRLPDAVLDWLLNGKFVEKSQGPCRQICNRERVVVGADPASGGTAVIAELGFGEPFGAAVAAGMDPDELIGRSADLDKHLGFLMLALDQRQHYLLTGKPGVGKTLFLRHLLARALQAADTVGTAFRGARFVLFRRSDFAGAESENVERFGRLYSYLQEQPNVVPVFDELEHIIQFAPKLGEHFGAMFGGTLAAGGRTFVLVCETTAAGNSPLLKSVRPTPLPVLTADATRSLVLRRSQELAETLSVRIDPNPEEFASKLVNVASERYPGRFFPELGIHLVESAARRARNRIAFLKQEPFDAVTTEDLWGHVVEEQGLNPETFGKDPTEFYRNLKSGLKNKVIAQDHAVDLICDSLEMQAGRPPQRAPRGRFLFVGPPGVGKTQLARSLAKALGMSDEAFFVFNMSEYSTEAARTRFMGADPGYVGFGRTRTIYQAVREYPSCVVLLDEIDRADASIQDILLSILEGEGKDAEGQSVYFSQAIFVATTNLGQEAVEAAYQDVVEGRLSRQELTARFDDDTLRRLVLEGAVDDVEVGMQRTVDSLIASAKQDFRIAQEAEDTGARVDAIGRYTELKGLRDRLQAAVQRSPLDRALLDRLDFIIPFFPVKEPESLARILALELKNVGWEDCEDSIRNRILDEALRQKDSVRPLKRLVKKYLAREVVTS